MSESDRAQMKEMAKYGRWTGMAMESCIGKMVLSGVLGFGLGAFFSLMSASFAIDDPVRQATEDRLALERAKRLEEEAVSSGKAAKPAANMATAAPGSATGSAAKVPGSSLKPTLPPVPPLPEVNTMQSTKKFFVQTGKSMYSSGKGFGKVGAIYSGIECCIEGYRARSDIWNPVVAGFLSGGILARHSGPRAMFAGGMAFAAFSGAIDLFLHRSTPDED
ncbi:Tim22p [Malassezia vespertilionis]|uniref:Mitochondrial import inner membrane translocase subunit TIM22 n=2 Tax=Malassezia vespertilionis TaxID=2020962 RepID=A0A2N1JEA0_9BASI|nr:Tim22p [Malassezia vespertilionis]